MSYLNPISSSSQPVNAGNALPKLSLFRRIKNCLTNPKTLMALGVTLTLVGAGILVSSAFLPQFAPILWVAGGVVTGAGLLLGVVGLALKKYNNGTESKSARTVNADILKQHVKLSSQELMARERYNLSSPCYSGHALLHLYKNLNSYGVKSGQAYDLILPHLFNNPKHVNNNLIRTTSEAKEFMKSPVVWDNYKNFIHHLVHSDEKLEDMLGNEFIIPAWQSISLFACVSEEPLFQEALTIFFNGELEPNTAAFLNDK